MYIRSDLGGILRGAVKQTCPVEHFSLNLWFTERPIEAVPVTLPYVGSIFGQVIKSAIITGVIYFSCV
jgi:hypothetical protein